MTMNIIYLARASVLLLVNVSLHAKFEVPSFTHSEDIMRPQNLKWITDHVMLVILRLKLCYSWPYH